MSRRRLARRPLAPVAGPLARVRRRWLYAALATVALAGSIVVPALPAAADTGNITFDTVTGDGTGNMSVTVTSDDPLASITVSLWPGTPDTGTAALTSSDFTERGAFSAGLPQTWILNSPSTDLATLPPGTYTATAIATDADQDQTTPTDQPLTGSFTLDGQPSITIGPATIFTTAMGQGFTLSGQVNILDPLTGTTAGFGGQSVLVTQVGSTNEWPATTASDGSYTVAVTGNPGDQYRASVTATSFSPTTSSTSTAEDSAQYAHTTLTASASPAPYGQQSITGTLTYYQQSGFTPTGAPSGVTITATAPGWKKTTTTQPGGSFSMMLPALIGTTTWQLSTQDDETSNPFLAGTQAVIGATQLWPDAITGFTVGLAATGTLTVGGCLARTITSPPASPDYPRVEIEYRTTASGTWIELGTVPTAGDHHGCAGAGFLAQGPAPVPSAYYRAYFPGSNDSLYEPATSSSTGRIWKYPTRFSSFTASPTTVSAGGKITVSGTLQQFTNKWHPYASQRVVLIYSLNWRARPSDQVWFVYGVVRTNIRGHFSKTFVDPARRVAAWSANYNGNNTHFVVSAPERVVHVLRTVSARADQIPLSATGEPAQIVSRLGPWADSGLPGFPFVLAADPLLALMGKQR